MGKSVKDYDLPTLKGISLEHESTLPKEIADELSIKVILEDLETQSKLNPEQEEAFKEIIEKVDPNSSGVFFIDGPGGTGKTYLYKALLANVRSRGMIGLATATCGVAAAIMSGGCTAHSRFGIPIDVHESSESNYSKQEPKTQLIKRARLILWDEAPMAKRCAIEMVDRFLRDIMNNNELFGGKVVVFGGDFRQVLPVVPRGTRSETVGASLVRSYLWHHMRRLKLSRNMRASSDLEFSKLLLRIGNGEEPTIDDDMISLPEEMIIKYDNCESSNNRLIDSVYPSLRKNAALPEYITNLAILATKNEYVDELNTRMISLFPRNGTIFKSFDIASDDENNYYQEEFLNTLMPNGLPPHILELKKNCPIMLLQNLDPPNGLCNGTRMVCRGFERNVIHAEITVGQHVGKCVFLPKIPLSPAEARTYPFKFVRKQFPVRLCFSMTINKAQGQTIPNVGVYLPEDVFSHGQLYMALSRGVSMSTTKLKKKGRAYVKDVVYKEVLTS